MIQGWDTLFWLSYFESVVVNISEYQKLETQTRQLFNCFTFFPFCLSWNVLTRGRTKPLHGQLNQNVFNWHNMHLFTCSTFYVRTWPPPVLAPVGQLGVFLSKFLSPIMTHSTFTSPRLFLMCTHFHSPNIPSSYTTDHVHSFSPSSVLSSLAHLLHIIA